MKKTTGLTIKCFIKHIKKYKWLAAVMLTGLTVGVGIDIYIPFLFKEFFDTLISDAEKTVIAGELIKILIMVLGIEVMGWFLWRMTDFAADYFFSRIMFNIRNEAFSYLHKHSYTFFNNNFVGSLVKKVSKLVHAFEGVVSKFFWDILPLALRVSTVIVILFFVNSVIGWIMLGWTTLFMIFNYLFSVFRLKYDIQRSKADTRITGVLADTITNNINLKLFTSNNVEEERFKKVNEDWRKRCRFTWNLGSVMESIQGALMISLEFFLFYLGVKFWVKDLLTLGDFILIQAYLITLLQQLWDFGRILRDTYQNFDDAEEMIEIMNTPHEVVDVRNAKILKIKKGKIEFKKVIFAYDKGLNVINNLDLNIKAGEKVAFIGPSGGGKSTVIKLLFRFFDTNDGKIIIDDQNIKEVTQESLRQNLSLVPQDPILFHRTLLENIRYGKPEATNEEVIAAAMQSNCHQFISKFTQKYDTYVGERGVKLSGGERQRVAIARALLKNAPILVLDEATSSLDSESEALIQEALNNLMKGKTTIVIAHRLSTIMQMDRIIVIKDGQIHETGTHKELTQKQDGLYKMLWELQAGGFIQ